ncbi:MAG: (Fe-S)-binding protein [Candidatus Helarchaeota archaeon]
MTLQKFQFSLTFKEDACDFCGLCFHKCPVLKLPIELAQNEIKSLVKSGRSKYVLNKCTSCMACNHYCPNNCNPHSLILSKWNERYLKKGLPERARLALPYHFPNLYSLTIKHIPKDEKNLIKIWNMNWKNPPDSDVMIYTGCNSLLQPFLLDSKIFKDIPIFGSLELCCGEPLYRMGCLDAGKTVGEYLKEQFDQMKIRKMITVCLAGYHMFKYVYNDIFNIKFNFEVVSIIDWLWEQIQKGEIEPQPLKKTVAIHDNCWPKASGNIFFEKVRNILKAFEIDVVEPKHTRENALCCGIGAAASNYSIIYSVKSARKRLRELDVKGADFIVDYCGGCNWYLTLAKNVSLSKLPIYHLIEIVQMGIGEKIKHRTDQRIKNLLLSIMGKSLASYLRVKRFWIAKIMDKPVIDD